MASKPTVYRAEADVPLTAPDPDADGLLDDRVQAVTAKALELVDVINAQFLDSPQRQLILRYADLVSQAAFEAAQNGPRTPTEEPPADPTARRPPATPAALSRALGAPTAI